MSWRLSKSLADIGKTLTSSVADAKGPRAFCTGTLLPCVASNRCRHFGVHDCSTFKKHSKHACPHHPDHDFRCTRLDDNDGGSLEKHIESA